MENTVTKLKSAMDAVSSKLDTEKDKLVKSFPEYKGKRWENDWKIRQMEDKSGYTNNRNFRKREMEWMHFSNK